MQQKGSAEQGLPPWCRPGPLGLSQAWFLGIQVGLNALGGFQAGKDPAQAIRKLCTGISGARQVAVADLWFPIGHNSLGTGLPRKLLKRRSRD